MTKAFTAAIRSPLALALFFALALLFTPATAPAQDLTTLTIRAEQGDADAQFNLGNMYAGRRGIPQDDATAVKWYTKAAEQGDTNAQYNLGVMYDNGRGIPQDFIKAHMWWNLAAAQGDEDAMKNRDLITMQMTPTQIAEAQAAVRACVARGYKGC